MINTETEYIQLLEETLLLVQKRGDLFQRVIGNYGSHKAEEYLKSIRELEISIKENTSKIRDFKEGKETEIAED